MASDGTAPASEPPTPVRGEEGSSGSSGCTGWDNGACEGTPYCPPRCPRFFDGAGRPLLVRRYRESDFRALVGMYDAIEASSMGLPPLTRAGIEEWIASLGAEGWNLVALAAGRVIGHVGIAPVDAPEPEIVVFVADAYQGRGVGTELVAQAVAHASVEGYDALTLTVSRGNDAAIAVYRAVGFDVVGRTSGELEMRHALDEPVVDAIRRPPADRESAIPD